MVWLRLPEVLALERAIRRSAEILLEDWGVGKEGRIQEGKSNYFLKWNFSAQSPSPLLCSLLVVVIDTSAPRATVRLRAKHKVKDHVALTEHA